LKAQILQLNVT